MGVRHEQKVKGYTKLDIFRNELKTFNLNEKIKQNRMIPIRWKNK